MSITKAIEKARESPRRKFKQTFDLIISLKNLDLKKPENRIKTEVVLPKGIGKSFKIGVIVDSLIPKAKDIEDIVLIKKNELEKLGKNKKAAKKLANECKYFVAEAPLMPLVGKNLGQVLAIRNKMPKPIPPTIPDLKKVVENSRKIIRIALKTSPVIQCPVGSEDLDDKMITENIEAVVNSVSSALPRGKEQIKECYVKLTMGEPVKFKV